ncbi:MAG: ATP-binding cassette domain-containing protein [Acidobacteria bacterium]|nr:ATP-binding cassette domain-containing protein [Acidobacteriota bacterium]
MPTDTILEIAGLTHFYGDRKALSNVSFQVYEGEIFGLLGPNGGGKTTLFRILSTLLKPSSGTAKILGLDVATRPQEVRRRIGIVFQSSSVDGKLTSAENLRHQGHLYGMRGRRLQQQVDYVLNRLGMANRRDDLMETLSGGLRRRVEIAKGLLHRPGLLMLDEPTTGLDPGVRAELWDYLNTLRTKEGVTVLVTTHLLDEAEKCDRLAILNCGELVASGTPTSLKNAIGAEVVMVESRSPEVLREQLRRRFSLEASVFGQRVRFEHPRGHEIVPQLMEAFPAEIDSLTVGKPTLEDVFLHQTGQRFRNEEIGENAP